ncbi:uncharacterized protein BJX67DRAFT_254941 [Aspergillus lucknowensis]|uniref:Uncharacterized protein n=1 Tax=Aspergillus lucknowensis TaxID=176173 RepID=A0ABR4LGC2_9EURO
MSAVKGSAVKGSADKWALVNNESVVHELTLDKLLETVDARQRGCILAYRRLPLTGILLRPAANPATVPSNPMQGVLVTPMALEDGSNGSALQVVSGTGVLLEQAINLREGIEWTVKQHLPFPSGVSHLIELKGKARKQRAKFNLSLTSPATGEVLEGEVSISLAPKNRRKGGKTPNTTANVGSGKAATLNGVTNASPSRAIASTASLWDGPEGSSADPASQPKCAGRQEAPTPMSIESLNPDAESERNIGSSKTSLPHGTEGSRPDQVSERTGGEESADGQSKSTERSDSGGDCQPIRRKTLGSES